MAIFLRPSQRRQFIRIHPELKTSVLLSYLITTSVLLLSLVFLHRLPPEIPVFYTLSQGDQQLAAREWIFAFGGVLAALSFAQFFFASRLADIELPAAHIFSKATLLLQGLVVFALLRILVIIS